MMKQAIITMALALAMMGGLVSAADRDHVQLKPPYPQRSDGKIEVIEFFWFGCPHCYRLEPGMLKWLKTKPDDVAFRRIAPPLNASWENHARAFYAAQQMKVSERFEQPMFDALHRDQRRLYKLDDIASFAAELGINKQEFLTTMSSFGVQLDITRAQELAGKYRITGVPALVVNGKYLTSVSLAGSESKLFATLDRLIAEERRTSSKTAK